MCKSVPQIVVFTILTMASGAATSVFVCESGPLRM
jgi:hypothetical protein